LELNVTHAEALRRYLAALDKAIGDLTETRYAIWQNLMDARNVSALGDRRERSVCCSHCRKPGVLAIDGICESCWLKLDAPGLAS
jgi:hypothetical protein